MLSTLILPTSGEVEINNLDLVKDSSKIKEIINISPQETAGASNLTVLVIPGATAFTLIL